MTIRPNQSTLNNHICKKKENEKKKLHFTVRIGFAIHHFLDLSLRNSHPCCHFTNENLKYRPAEDVSVFLSVFPSSIFSHSSVIFFFSIFLKRRARAEATDETGRTWNVTVTDEPNREKKNIFSSTSENEYVCNIDHEWKLNLKPRVVLDRAIN